MKLILTTLAITCLFIAEESVNGAAASQSPDKLTYEQRVAVVTNIPGCVAFWDFIKREPDGLRRFTVYVSAGVTNDFALDAGNYVRDYWGEGRGLRMRIFLCLFADRSDRQSEFEKKRIKLFVHSSLCRVSIFIIPRLISKAQTNR